MLLCYSTTNHSGLEHPPDGIDMFINDRLQQMETSSGDNILYEMEIGREEQMERISEKKEKMIPQDGKENQVAV